MKESYKMLPSINETINRTTEGLCATGVCTIGMLNPILSYRHWLKCFNIHYMKKNVSLWYIKFHFSLLFILPLWNIFLKNLKCSNDINQLILSFATLGCHSNKEDNVVNTLLKEHEKTIN